MTRKEFDAFCGSLPATTHVVQWGNASVWKVGGKIFAICSRWRAGDSDGEAERFSFKCSDLAYQMLIEEDGLVPAPYLARAKWVQVTRAGALCDDDLKQYITAAHQIISSKLTRKQRQTLGL